MIVEKRRRRKEETKAEEKEVKQRVWIVVRKGDKSQAKKVNQEFEGGGRTWQ